uniref:Core shell protein Gag P30 domain-containing protein n=1 Tax=Felis catus TaxID=9685 RepID=A0ABI7W3G1_FELCA
MAEGKERLRVYCQTLMGGLRMAARKPTNLAKVGNVQQGKDESPAAFLERIMEAFCTYTPMDPEAPESKAAVIMAFVNQSAIDIRKKLQKIDRPGEKSLQDLLVVAEKVYNNWEPPEDKQAPAMEAASSKQTQDLARILLATTADSPEERDHRLRQLAGDSRGGSGTRY